MSYKINKFDIEFDMLLSFNILHNYCAKLNEMPRRIGMTFAILYPSTRVFQTADLVSCIRGSVREYQLGRGNRA